MGAPIIQTEVLDQAYETVNRIATRNQTRQFPDYTPTKPRLTRDEEQAITNLLQKLNEVANIDREHKKAFKKGIPDAEDQLFAEFKLRKSNELVETAATTLTIFLKNEKKNESLLEKLREVLAPLAASMKPSLIEDRKKTIGPRGRG